MFHCFASNESKQVIEVFVMLRGCLQCFMVALPERICTQTHSHHVDKCGLDRLGVQQGITPQTPSVSLSPCSHIEGGGGGRERGREGCVCCCCETRKQPCSMECSKTRFGRPPCLDQQQHQKNSNAARYVCVLPLSPLRLPATKCTLSTAYRILVFC